MRCLKTLAFAFFLASPAITPAADPQHNYKVLGSDRGKVALVGLDGKVEWEYANGTGVHDLAMLPNGNIMFQSGPATVIEVSPSKKTVWSYTSKPKAPYTGPIEVHAFQRLADGLTMIAETGNKRIIEVDADGKIVHETPLTIKKPHPHRDTRLARKLDNGHYLVAHEGDGMVREYEPSGKVVWSYELDLAGRPRAGGHDGHGTEVFSALREPNGNTLIGAGNGNRVIEVDPQGKIVWSLEHDELPGIELAWVTTVKLLPNGNIIVGNCHAGPKNPQLIEVTRDKKAVWTFKNFETFGNDLASTLVLTEDAKPSSN